MTLMRLVLLLIALILVAIVGWVILERAMHGDWNKSYAILRENESVRAQVHGYTDNPLTGWEVELLWENSEDKWFVYYLNHESYFEKYQLKRRGDFIDVYCNEAVLANLDTTTGRMFHLRQKLMYEKPVEVIHSAHIQDREKWERWRTPVQ